jgi:hypothetical protein
MRCIARKVDCKYTSINSEGTIPNKALKRQIDQLQGDLSEHADLLEHLLSIPEPEAVSVIRRLRATPNVSVVLSTLRGSAHTAARLSEVRTSRAVLATEFETEVELSVLHKSVYSPILPLDIDYVDMGSLRTPLSRELVPAPSLAGTQMGAEIKLSITPDINILRPSLSRETVSRRQSPVEGPVKTPQYCDSRLGRLDISYWTCIPVSNEFAASVLSFYLEGDHPIYACVDADLFIDDLVGLRLDHCSAFLVSALMAFACQSYTQFDRRASALGTAFMDEAQNLRRSEQRSQTCTHLAALSYLALAAGASGSDELGIFLAAECYALAKELKLLGVPPSNELASKFHSLPLNEFKSYAFAAWGLYAWLTYRSIYYPEEAISFPPLLPIPGDAERRTEFKLPLTWPSHPVPAYMGQTFQTLSKLWVMIQEINMLYVLTDKKPLSQRVSLSYAEAKYQSLLHWSDSLASGMLQSNQCESHVLFFHSLFHSTVLTLFYPFQTSAKESRLRSFSSADATPSSIYKASLNQLKHLVRGYYTRQQRLATQCWFNTAILRVSTEIIKHWNSDPEWYFYFQLCFQYWKEAYVCYRSFRLIAQANLAAALQYHALSGDIATTMLEEITALGQHHVAVDEAVVGGLFDVDRGPHSIEDSRIVTFAKRFEDFRLFNELTTGDLGSVLGTESS